MVDVVDRSSMRARMERALAVGPATSAVVTIDCQRGNLDPAIASLPVPEPECRRVIDGTNRLIALARAAGVPVVHVTTVYEEPLLASHPFERAMMETKQSFTPHGSSDFARHKRPGSEEALIVPELDVRPEDLLVDSKRTFDMFQGTPLELLLRFLKRDTLLVAGCNTNTCVLASTFGAYNRGFKVVVLADCVASAYGPDLHHFALENISRRLGWVLTLDELRAKLPAAPARLAAAAGHSRTAGTLYLRAGFYYYTGERFVPPGEEKRRHYLKSLRCCQEGIRRRHPAVEFVEVPYEKTTLPAYFLKAEGARGPAPTVVVFDGMDNCKEMSILFAGLEFSARGMNVLSIDGPGQGESLRARDIHSRHDYEVPGTAAYEFVARRPEVDPKKVVVMGYSFGGYQVPRICAFERRYAAGVAFGAMHWDMHAWVSSILTANQADPKKSFSTTWQFPWVMGARDTAHALEIAKRFSLEGVADKVACPFLTVHGEDDRVVPVESAHRVHEAVGSKNKTLRIFTGEEGAAEHVQVDDRQRGVDYIADWIATTLG